MTETRGVKSNKHNHQFMFDSRVYSVSLSAIERFNSSSSFIPSLDLCVPEAYKSSAIGPLRIVAARKTKREKRITQDKKKIFCTLKPCRYKAY